MKRKGWTTSFCLHHLIPHTFERGNSPARVGWVTSFPSLLGNCTKDSLQFDRTQRPADLDIYKHQGTRKRSGDTNISHAVKVTMVPSELPCREPKQFLSLKKQPSPSLSTACLQRSNFWVPPHPMIPTLTRDQDLFWQPVQDSAAVQVTDTSLDPHSWTSLPFMHLGWGPPAMHLHAADPTLLSGLYCHAHVYCETLPPQKCMLTAKAPIADCSLYLVLAQLTGLHLSTHL